MIFTSEPHNFSLVEKRHSRYTSTLNLEHWTLNYKRR